MFETISELAVIYFQVGGIAGFGLGALAQVIEGKSQDWTLRTSLAVTLFWPFIFLDAARSGK